MISLKAFGYNNGPTVTMALELVTSLMHYDEKQKEPVVCQECNGKPEI